MKHELKFALAVIKQWHEGVIKASENIVNVSPMNA